MKRFAFILLFALPVSLFAQVKIDAGYELLWRGAPAITSDSTGIRTCNVTLEGLEVKELASGKVCKVLSYEASFMIQNEIFKVPDQASFKQYVGRIVPGSKFFMDKFKLETGCFAPPKSVVVTW